MNIIPLREEELADFDAWMQLIRKELGDVKKCLMMVQREDGSRRMFFLQCDCDDLTIFSTYACDYASKKRDEEYY